MYIIISVVSMLIMLVFTWLMFHKGYEWAPICFIIMFIGGMLLFGALCGQKIVDRKEVIVQPGQFDYAKSKYKYIINYWYQKNGVMVDSYFVGSNKYEYDKLNDSAILVLRFDYNSYGVEMERGYKLVSNK